MVFGMDNDPSASWSGKTNLALHGLGGSHLYERDALDLARIPLELGSFDVVAGNPPFGDTINDPGILEQFELGRDNDGRPLNRQSSEALFVEAFLRLAVPGGRVVILVPDGLLANQGEQRVRDFLTGHAIVEAVIGLPRRVFRNDAKSNILLLRKQTTTGEPQERPVFLATVEDIWSELGDMLDLYRSGPKSK
jgi:type I restriction enzyme M protein